MIEDLKPYPEYKQSGLPWLGQVPSHWVVAPIGRHLRVKSGDMIAPKDEREDGVPIYGGNGIRGYTYQPNTIGPILLLGRVGAKCGCVHLVAGDIWASEHALRVLFTTPSNLRFFAYLLKHADLNRLAIRTAQPLINSTIVRSYRAALPSPDEQAAIVRFLGWSNGRLRRAIRAKRKVIALLNEQKQAIIHGAVTRGLDPLAHLKPSGIAGLGDIPEHWETPLNQRIFKEEVRPHNGTLEIPLSLSQRDGLIATSDMKERSLQTASYDNWKVTLPGDLVLNRFKAHLGVFFGATIRGMVSFHYGVFAPRRQLHTKYFELLFHTYPYRAIFAGRSNGMTVGLQNLSNQNFYGVRAVVPPYEEQLAIVDIADRETYTTRTAISRLEREIELLREYRTRLVADVVTGKLDVRAMAAQLPDEPPLDIGGENADSGEEVETADEETAA